ncbi:MAG: site-2 protease family protein [Acidimicrobiales bacterium]
MESSNIRLGKIAGVPVGLSWTLLIIAAVFALGLAEARFPSSEPGYSATAYWLAAVVTVFVFFASILAHELAHAIVAKRNGMQVDGITLWLLGGVARMSSESPDAGVELRVAGVGPLSSAALAGVFGAAAWGAGSVGLEPLAVTVLAWLALINGVLAVFNAVPAAPLDGGRVLAAVWWWRTGSRTKGLVAASMAGRLLGGGLVAFALYELIYGESTMALWTGLVGWFIWQSASSEGKAAVARGNLAGITTVEAARPDPPVLDEWLTVDGLIAMMGDGGGHTGFVVRESDGVLRSIVTLDDVKRVPPTRRGAVPLGEIATPIADLTTAWSTESLLAVIDRIPDDHRPEIVVYDDRMCLVGVISRADLTRLIHQMGAVRQPLPPPPPPPRTDASRTT